MLRISIDLIVHGEGEPEHLGSVEIVNDGSHSLRPMYGNYKVRFLDENQKLILKRAVAHHRRGNGFWTLIQWAFNSFNSKELQAEEATSDN